MNARLFLISRSSVPHPIHKTDYVVELRVLFPGSSLEITGTSFGGSDTLLFDPRGIPKIGGTVVLKGSGGTWTVNVAGDTGRLSVVESG